MQSLQPLSRNDLLRYPDGHFCIDDLDPSRPLSPLLRGHDSEERDKRADKNMKGFQLRRRSSSHMENLDQVLAGQ